MMALFPIKVRHQRPLPQNFSPIEYVRNVLKAHRKCGKNLTWGVECRRELILKEECICLPFSCESHHCFGRAVIQPWQWDTSLPPSKGRNKYRLSLVIIAADHCAYFKIVFKGRWVVGNCSDAWHALNTPIALALGKLSELLRENQVLWETNPRFKLIALPLM